jgi:Transposase
MQAVIDSVASGVPVMLTEIRKLGRTLKQRATDILAFFDRPGTSNGPTEALNGGLEHLRGSALGFRNLTKTSHARCSKPADSDPDYTLDWDEPSRVRSRRTSSSRSVSRSAERRVLWSARGYQERRACCGAGRPGPPQGSSLGHPWRPRSGTAGRAATAPGSSSRLAGQRQPVHLPAYPADHIGVSGCERVARGEHSCPVDEQVGRIGLTQVAVR